MYDATILTCAVLGTIAAILTVLPLFGVDLSFRRGPGMSPEISASPKDKREKRLWTAVGLAVVSVVLSGASFYRLERPRVMEKIVEKPVDRIVEKVVPAVCPKPPACAPSQQKKESGPQSTKPNVKQRGAGNDTAGDIHAGPCSNVQVGGANNQATTNCGPPPLELNPSLRIVPSDKGRFAFPVEECPVHTQITITPNQAVPPPIEIALEFDNPVTKIAAAIDGVNALMLGGPFRLGTHALTTVVSPGIGPHNSLIVEVCSSLPVKLVAPPRLED